MEETVRDLPVDDFVCMDRAEPKRKVLASDGVLYAALLVAVVGVIVLGNLASQRLGLPRAIVQIVLYAVLLALAWLVYRYRLTAFRYVLTKRMLSVDRIVGKKIKADAAVHLADIESIRPFGERADGGRRQGLYTGRRKEALALCACENGKRRTLVISPSEEFAGKLIEAWKSMRK